jgi:hypothetical protein
LTVYVTVELSLLAAVPFMTNEIAATADDRVVGGGGAELQLITAKIVDKANDETDRFCCMP